MDLLKSIFSFFIRTAKLRMHTAHVPRKAQSPTARLAGMRFTDALPILWAVPDDFKEFQKASKRWKAFVVRSHAALFPNVLLHSRGSQGMNLGVTSAENDAQRDAIWLVWCAALVLW
jgi:hypothetical protein